MLPKYVKSKPFLNGYRDFTPWPKTSVQDTPRWKPNGGSLLSDISNYWTAIASPDQIECAIRSPFNATTFQLQIVASIWMNTLSDIYATLSRGEESLWILGHCTLIVNILTWSQGLSSCIGSHSPQGRIDSGDSMLPPSSDFTPIEINADSLGSDKTALERQR